MASQYCHYQGRRRSYLNPNAQEFHPTLCPIFSPSTTRFTTTQNNYYYHNYYYHPNNNINIPHFSPSIHLHPHHHSSLLHHHHLHHFDFMQLGQPHLGLAHSSAPPPTTAQLSPGPAQTWPISPSPRWPDGVCGGARRRGRRSRRSVSKHSGNSSNYGRKQGFKCNDNNNNNHDDYNSNNNHDYYWSKRRELAMRNNLSSSNNQKIMLVKPDGVETTAMIRNIPNQYTREMLIKLLDEFCLKENQKLDSNDDNRRLAYDFLYLPMDFRRDANKGYAFVNFTNPIALWKLHLTYSCRGWEHCRSPKICRINCATIQGKESLVEHFGRSTFVCDHDDYLPVCFDPPRDGSGASVAETTIGNRFSPPNLGK